MARPGGLRAPFAADERPDRPVPVPARGPPVRVGAARRRDNGGRPRLLLARARRSSGCRQRPRDRTGVAGCDVHRAGSHRRDGHRGRDREGARPRGPTRRDPRAGRDHRSPRSRPSRGHDGRCVRLRRGALRWADPVRRVRARDGRCPDLPRWRHDPLRGDGGDGRGAPTARLAASDQRPSRRTGGQRDRREPQRTRGRVAGGDDRLRDAALVVAAEEEDRAVTVLVPPRETPFVVVAGRER